MVPAMTPQNEKSIRFTEYIRNNQDRLYRFAYSHVRNQDDALDIVHDAIVKGLEKIDTLRQTDNMGSWFYRILINECINHFRRLKKVVYCDQMPELSDEDQDISAAADLYRAVGRLPLPYKTIIILRFYEDMKIEDIASATGISINTVKTRLYRALEKLREDLGDSYPSEYE